MRISLYLLLLIISGRAFTMETLFIKTICDSKSNYLLFETVALDLTDDSIYSLLFDKPKEMKAEEYLKNKYNYLPYPISQKSVKCINGKDTYEIYNGGTYQTFSKNQVPLLSGFKMSHNIMKIGALINVIEVLRNKMKICYFKKDSTYWNKPDNFSCNNYDITI